MVSCIRKFLYMMCIFFDIKACFDAMALLPWLSAPEAKLITNFQQKNEQ